MLARLTIAALAVATPLQADSLRVWAMGVSSAIAQLHAPEKPGAVATLTFQNENAHTADETFDLEWNGIKITATMTLNVDAIAADKLTVTPPDGFFAIPQKIVVPDGDTQKIHIYSMGDMS